MWMRVKRRAALTAALLLFVWQSAAIAAEDTLSLDALIEEALSNSREARMSGVRSAGAGYRAAQESSLPDPMFMVGYQNEGYDRYTYGEMPDAQWMFSASQMVPYPGKRALKGNMAAKEAESLRAMQDSARLDVAREVKERYYDLFFAHKGIALIEEKKGLFLSIENAAGARYLSGMAPQQEAIMAQTEKYMLIERQEMLRQRVEAGEAMLNRAVGRQIGSPLGRPAEPKENELSMQVVYPLNDAIKNAVENSPEIKAKRKMVEAAEFKLAMAKREYYPDFTFTGSLFKRGGEFDDMWSLTASVNVPIFYKTKQRSAVLEAEEGLREARLDLEGAELMVASSVRDNYSMALAASRLMAIYKDSLMPKTRQSYEAGLAGYASGKVELMALIRSLASLLDYEILYWGQFAEMKKAEARIEALMGSQIPGGAK